MDNTQSGQEKTKTFKTQCGRRMLDILREKLEMNMYVR